MIIQSKKVYFNEKLQPLQIEIEGSKIKKLLPYGTYQEVKDYGENIILPGLVDIHNHGYNQGDCNHATKEWLKKWTSYLPSEGVTSTLFSFGCGDFDHLFASLNQYKEFEEMGHEGTQILGAYSEGPFVGAKPGAQNTNFKLIASEENVKRFNEACGNRLVYVMLAPEELKGNYDVIRYCRKQGITVSIGHSSADFETCQQAIDAGVTSFTHTYNGMSGLHHREPGVVGAAMYHEDCYAELICDGVHVNKYAANILSRLKGKDKLILITDSVYVKGFKPGMYELEGKTVIVDEEGRVTTPTGTISGSSNKLNKVLRFAIKKANIDPVIAYNACTKNPCEMLGFKDKGKLEKGYDADIAVFNEDYDVIATYIMGKEYSFNS